MAPTILLVEDDDDIRTLATLLLHGAGYTVLGTAHGQDGLRLLAEHPVDLVILDINLPGIDGWEVARRLRADPRRHRLPILVFTVLSTRPDPAVLELVDGYLSKPFERDDFLAAVAALLAPSAPTPAP